MTTLDWIVVAVYLGGVVALGIWVGRREEGVDDYFLGGRAIPWWAALLSMVATEISAATFLGAPEQGYTRDLTYLQFGIGSILARFVLAFLFLGVYYKLRVYTVYGFLAHRFGNPTKNTAAGVFLVGRVFAGGSRLFIAALAVKVATGLPLSHSILLLGALAIFYTFFGGIKAVIWTDVVQAVVLVGGALLSIHALLGAIDLPVATIWARLAAAGKLRFFDTAFSDGAGGIRLFSNAYHFIPAILGGFFLTMATHGTDQAMVQRMLTCKDSFRSKVSMVLSGFLGIGVTVLFMIVGMLLYVFVLTRPEGHPLVAVAAGLKASGKNGHFFLHYILVGLPAGVSGLIIASVLAAAMSSIDSELNAMSSTLVTDYYMPYVRPKADGSHYLKVARWATVASGIALIGLALLIADFYLKNPKTDLLSIALGVMTFFYGGLLGIFLVGLLTKGRGNGLSTIAGLLLSVVAVVAVSRTGLAWPWFIILGTATAAGFGLLMPTRKA